MDRPNHPPSPPKNPTTSPAILGRKALGLRSRMASTADWRTPSFCWLLQQPTQLQPSQYRPEAKHSQYLVVFWGGP